ncbi:MAG: LysR substrate-binding domain-containing protein, partial [Flavobacteriaceae bacterium]|nr:LysR substrate-binding domain-containing protein [Flavobacteriaceae bacterium]
MTITQLEYALAVARHKSFTKAAKACFVTQPTLSMQIQKLEEELDVSIFNRKKKPLALTEIGEKIITQATQIVQEAKRMQDIVDQEKGYIGGTFKLGIIPTVMPTLLPMFIHHFLKKYPEIDLHIEEQTTKNIIKNLHNEQLDAAILATPLEEEKIAERPIYYEPFVAYIPKHHPLHAVKNVDMKLLEDERLLLLQDGHCFRDHILNLCGSSMNEKKQLFTLESGSFETLIKLCDEGLGITLLPYLNSLDIEADKKNNIKKFIKPAPAREISIIYLKTGVKKHVIDALHLSIKGIIKA